MVFTVAAVHWSIVAIAIFPIIASNYSNQPLGRMQYIYALNSMDCVDMYMSCEMQLISSVHDLATILNNVLSRAGRFFNKASHIRLAISQILTIAIG